jgi:hypothetical protein
VKYFLIFALLIGLVVGCADDDNPVTPEEDNTDGTWSDDNGGWFAKIDATTDWVYYNLVDRELVTVTDPASDNNWHLSFNRINGKINGGSSGGLGMKGADLADLANADSTNFDTITTLPAIDADQWEEDEVQLRFNDWYSYNPQTHALSPSDKLFMMMTTDGGYAKVIVDSMNGAGAPPNMGMMTIKYVYNPDGTDLSGETQYAVIDGTDGIAYFSFADGEVDIADPTTSSDWDIMFSAYEAKTNSGISGPGEAAVWLGEIDQTFDELVTAEAGGGYFSDTILSIFGSEGVAGSTWYNYDGQLHEIVSKDHVYILDVDGTYFKIAITNYYNVIEGSPVSGWITLHYKEL